MLVELILLRSSGALEMLTIYENIRNVWRANLCSGSRWNSFPNTRTPDSRLALARVPRQECARPAVLCGVSIADHIQYTCAPLNMPNTEKKRIQINRTTPQLKLNSPAKLNHSTFARRMSCHVTMLLYVAMWLYMRECNLYLYYTAKLV